MSSHPSSPATVYSHESSAHDPSSVTRKSHPQSPELTAPLSEGHLDRRSIATGLPSHSLTKVETGPEENAGRLGGADSLSNNRRLVPPPPPRLRSVHVSRKVGLESTFVSRQNSVSVKRNDALDGRANARVAQEPIGEGRASDDRGGMGDSSKAGMLPKPADVGVSDKGRTRVSDGDITVDDGDEDEKYDTKSFVLISDSEDDADIDADVDVRKDAKRDNDLSGNVDMGNQKESIVVRHLHSDDVNLDSTNILTTRPKKEPKEKTAKSSMAIHLNQQDKTKSENPLPHPNVKVEKIAPQSVIANTKPTNIVSVSNESFNSRNYSRMFEKTNIRSDDSKYPGQSEQKARQSESIRGEECVTDDTELGFIYHGDNIQITPEYEVKMNPYSTLRSWQQQGVRWLVHNLHENQGVVLGDDPKLEPRIQIVTFVQGSIISNILRTIVIVVPSADVILWFDDLRRWIYGSNIYIFSKLYQDNDVYMKLIHKGGLLIVCQDAFSSLLNRNGEFLCNVDLLVLDFNTLSVNESFAIIKEAKTMVSRHSIYLWNKPIENNMKLFWLMCETISSENPLGTWEDCCAKYDMKWKTVVFILICINSNTVHKLIYFRMERRTQQIDGKQKRIRLSQGTSYFESLSY